MTARTIVVAIEVPDAVTDLALARRVQQVLRQACIAANVEGAETLLWPDPASIEVTVFPIPKEAFLTGESV